MPKNRWYLSGMLLCEFRYDSDMIQHFKKLYSDKIRWINTGVDTNGHPNTNADVRKKKNWKKYRNYKERIFRIINANATAAQAAAADDVAVFKFARWRRQGVVLDEVLSEYRSVGAELNVLPYCTQFIPMEVITAPRHQSIVYHPSLLPRHRGASSINWFATFFFIVSNTHN